MSILAQCPTCSRRQSTRNKKCRRCGTDLDRAKRAGSVRYWIAFRLNGKQIREFAGWSIREARDADGKRRAQKRENRILDIRPDSKMTFRNLTEWYLAQESVRAKKSFWLIKLSLKKFNRVFGDTIVADIKLADLKNYQARRLKEGRAPGTVDHEIGKAKTMINRAFDNDLVSGSVLKAFKRCKKALKPGTDVRDRILSAEEFESLLAHSAAHLRPILLTAYYTGMRRGEILSLTWDKVDLPGRVIRLDAANTKDAENRDIPICDELHAALKQIPRAIHDPHVFLYRGKPIKTVHRGLRDACEKAGIVYGRFKQGGFVFHDLRHTFNTNMRKAGVAESVIMAITGHSTREMFDRYNSVDGEDLREAAGRLEAFFTEIL